MQTTLKNIIGGVALGLALLANSVPTWAGQKISTEVRVSNTAASGSMTSARYSKDDLQKIGCSGGVNPIFEGSFASCFATDKVEHTLACVTTNPNMVQAVSAITDSSFLGFTTANGSGQCLSIDVNNLSAYLK